MVFKLQSGNDFVMDRQTDKFKGFKVTVQTRFCLRNCYLQSSKGHNSKNGITQKVMVLALCTSSNVGYYLYEVS